MERQATYARRWTRTEYEQLVDIGFFQSDEPLELIAGQLIVSEPQGSPHATAVGLAGDALRAAFGRGWIVREEKPVALDDDSEPEPDLAVVPGVHRDYAGGIRRGPPHALDCPAMSEPTTAEQPFTRVPDCDLCRAARITPWYHEDDLCWIAECDICETPMVVWRFHGVKPPAEHLAHMHARLREVAAERIGEFWMDDHMRNIPDHYHAHARPRGGFFGRDARRSP